MRITIMWLNAICAAFFVCLLGYSIFAKQHIEGLAREFVVDKTLEQSAKMVAVADKAVVSPMTMKLLTNEQKLAIQGELDDYHADPAGYVSDLVSNKLEAVEEDSGESENLFLKKVVSLKNRIRSHYKLTLNSLISDFRYLALTNLFAAGFGVVLAMRTIEARPPTLLFSFILFLAVLYSSYLYVDSLSFFRILVGANVGQWYSLVMVAIIVVLSWEDWRWERRKMAAQVAAAR